MSRYVVVRWVKSAYAGTETAMLNVLDLDALPSFCCITETLAGPFDQMIDAKHALLVGIGVEPEGYRCVMEHCYKTATAHLLPCRKCAAALQAVAA